VSEDARFSVVIPTRNRPELLARALHSALAQRHVGFDILVVDDGAGEGAEAARRLAGREVEILRTGGAGQVPARNLGVRSARGRWIAFLDDDDWWAADDHLAGLAAELSRGAGLAYASGRIVREGPEGAVLEEIALDARCDPASIRQDNTLLVPGVGYARALHERFGLYDESLTIYWDWDWYLRLSAGGVVFAASSGNAVRVSVREGTASAPDNVAVRAAELDRLCRKHGLTGVTLKNHDVIAHEQAARKMRKTHLTSRC
jgi:glycosyltransferase involved in cell wall biosynthesis